MPSTTRSYRRPIMLFIRLRRSRPEERLKGSRYVDEMGALLAGGVRRYAGGRKAHISPHSANPQQAQVQPPALLRICFSPFWRISNRPGPPQPPPCFARCPYNSRTCLIGTTSMPGGVSPAGRAKHFFMCSLSHSRRRISEPLPALPRLSGPISPKNAASPQLSSSLARKDRRGDGEVDARARPP